MAQRKTTELHSWQRKAVAVAMLTSVGSIANIAQAQTVVIGGSGSSPVEINLGAMNPSTPYAALVNRAYQDNLIPSQNTNQYSTSSRIVYGNEVITLTPPGSRPKRAKIIAAKKPSIKAKPEVTAKVVAPAAVVAKPAPEMKIAKIAPTVEKIAPKVEAPAKVKVSPQKAETTATPAPVTVKAEPVTPPKTATVVETPAIIAKTTDPLPAKSEKPAAKVETPKAVIPVKKKPAVKTPEPEMKVAAIAPEAKGAPVAAPSGSANHILFKPEQSKLPSSATGQLKEIANALKSNNDRIQLIAYADANSNSAARRLSLGRALVVRSKLMELGVPNNKIEVRALGKPKDDSPADRVELNLITR